MFKIGQAVVHPRYGAGKIIEITALIQREKKCNCYVIDPLLQDLCIKIPFDAVQVIGLRPPLLKEEIEQLLAFLSQPLTDFEVFLRTTKIAERMSLAQPRQVLQVIKYLFYEKIYRQQEGGRLSLSKRRLYEGAINLLASEIVFSFDCSLEEAAYLIRKSLVYHPPAQPILLK